jgi:hypothetical protein
MKAVEFQSELRSDHTLSVPTGVFDRIPAGRTLRVLVLVPEDAEDQAWEELAAADFGSDYSDGDAIYDQLLDR